MKISLFCFIAAILFSTTSEFSFSQSSLKRGQEFWVGAFPRIYTDDDTLSQPSVVHSTDDTLRLVIYSDTPTNVEISIPRTGWKRTIFTKDSSAYFVTLPKDLVVAWHTDTPEDKGVHVIADRPVSLSCYNLVQNFSDASLIYPKEVLGTEYIINCQYIYNPALVLLVGTEDATTINIEPATEEWGVAREIVLQSGQIYLLQAQADPTGLTISADKPIAVFSGVYNQDANPVIIPGFFGNGDGNLTYDQLLPVREWGRDYYSVPMDASAGLGKYPTWTRIVASANNTLVKINGREILVNKGKWVDSITNQPLVIRADKPVNVTQMASGIAEPAGSFPPELAGVMGDGTFLQLIGKDKMISGRSVFLPVASSGKIKLTVDDEFAGRTFVDFITVIAPTSERNAVYLDGKSIAQDFRAFTFDTAMSYAYVQVAKGRHELWSTGRYHLYQHGWGYSEAYSSSGGIKLGARKPAISFASACIGAPFELQGFAATGAVRWSWDFADGTGERTSNGTGQSPAGDDVTKITHTFLKTGTYPVRLRILYDWSDGVEDTVFRIITVSELPKPKITATDTVLCYGGSVKLHANTGYTKYQWMYEGSIVQPDPVSPFELTVSRAGTYTVAVTNENGCVGTSDIEIRVLPELIAGIKGAREACLEGIEEYNAESVIASGDINIKCAWGTSGGEIISGKNSPTVRVKWTGEGKQKLVFQMIDSITGCSKDTSLSVVVGTALTVTVTGKMVICDGMATELHAQSVENENLTYEWRHEGDVIANATDSVLKATKAGTYSVRITSVSGCHGEAVAEVSVAPLLEQPMISGKSVLCSDSDTILLNLGTPERYFHKQWLFDGAPLSGDTLGFFKAGKPGKYSVAVYNDAGCERIADFVISRFTINVKADTAICLNEQVQLDARPAENFKNVLYRWSPADGLSKSDIANPVAKPATTTTYRLYATTSDGLCTIEDSVTITVIPELKITAQSLNLCKGEVSQLSIDVENAQGQGNLRYEWSPSSGLSDPGVADPIVTASQTQEYLITVTNEAGCYVTQTVTVKVQEKEDIRAEIVGQEESVEPGESSAITLQIWSRFKELRSFKAKITYDASVFQFVPNSEEFLLGSANNWEIRAEEVRPGELTITASGTTPIQTTILGFKLAAYLAEQTENGVILYLEEVNGEPVVADSRCMDIQVKSAQLALDDVCAGDLRLIKLSGSRTEMQAIAPNPATGETVEIHYSVGIPGEATIEVFNHQGISVATLSHGFHPAGKRIAILDTKNLSPGVYLCKFTTQQVIQTQMITIVK